MRNLFLIIISNFLSIGVFAQQEFRLGLTATPTIGWIKPADADKMYANGSGVGFTYGLVGDFNFSKNYAFSTAVQLTSVLGNVTQVENVNGTDAKADVKYRMSYLEIPLAIKLSTEKIGDLRWFGKFGLSNGFRTGAKRDITINNQISQEKIADITYFYRAGLIIGGGAEYDINENLAFLLGLTFNNGFTNFLKTNGTTAKNHFIAINLGLNF